MNQQVKELRQRLREWPFNFLEGVWGQWASYPLKGLADTQEIIGSVEYVLAVSRLKNRELEIIRMHFQQGMTYREIADFFSLSRSRAGQILKHAMYKIRAKPQNKAILSIGVAAYTRYRQTVAENETVSRLVEARLKEVRLEDIRSRAKQHGVDLSQGSKATRISLFTHIEELPLSVRAYRCMYRVGIKTVADILAYDKKTGLRNIRNLGEKTHQEIIDLLTAADIDMPQDRLPARQPA